MSSQQNKIGITLLMAIFLVPLQFSYADYDTFTVNVPNAQGGYTSVIVKKSGDGYTGPQGEFYASFPTVSQLQIMYRLGQPAPTPVIVQEPVQTVTTTQVIYQNPVVQTEEDEDDQDFQYAPVVEPSITEVIVPNGPREEDRELTFFEFKKKKKSKQSEDDHHNTTKPAGPSNTNSTPPPQKKKDDPVKGGNPDPKNHDKDKQPPQTPPTH